jgi:hypothetical protein
MSDEEFNRKMDFIVEQQAQFAADIQVMREVHDADVKLLKEQDRRLSNAIATTAELVGELVAAHTRTDAQVSESNVRTDAKLAELAEAQLRTDDRLNVLINTVERYISGNGKKPSGNSP